ncbi:MAG TPA: hypothetical protein VKV73_12595 [Chloroflexota bacterium]|nr:hypothetical protein [Chloroflexota bacterium]
MSQAALHLRLPLPTLFGRWSMVRVDPWVLGMTGLAAFAMAVRVAAADQQSAFMDEATVVLTGRMLMEQHAVYAEFLNWAYCSYLWPVLAGAADMFGGLAAVRGLSATFGVLMVLATSAAAARLAPAGITPARRWGVALLAGGIMALAPTAVGVGRFGTYDALSGAAFMLGMAVLAPIRASSSGPRLLAAAALLFVAFLAKYLVAIYFPFVCLYVLCANVRSIRTIVHHAAWFALPLSAACAGYAVAFLDPLLSVLHSASQYGDLKSANPLHEYVWTRPELVLLLAVAVLGWRRASSSGRVVALGGAGIIMAFQVIARADFDFWKHSIYAIYFLAPLAGLIWLAVPQHTGTWRVLSALTPGLAAIWLWSPVIQQADRLVEFYPNLNPSIAAVRANVAGSTFVLSDDTALRYYLYPGLDPDRVVGPFAFSYRSQDGLEGYRHAIADRFFDAIVLDGGVGPQANSIRTVLGPTIQTFYQNVYSQTTGQYTVEVFKAIRPAGAAGSDSTGAPWPVDYTFDSGVDGWGAHPDATDWQAGGHISATTEQTWDGHASLQFTPTADTTMVSVRREGSVTRVRANVYLVPADGSTGPLRIGFIGFDSAWNWHDDAFRWGVPPRTWTSVTWDLPAPGDYKELGLKFPPGVSTAFVGSFEIDP